MLLPYGNTISATRGHVLGVSGESPWRGAGDTGNISQYLCQAWNAREYRLSVHTAGPRVAGCDSQCRDCGMTPFPPCEYDTLLAVSMRDEERTKRHAGGDKSVGNAGMSASRCDSGVGMVDEGYYLSRGVRGATGHI